MRTALALSILLVVLGLASWWLFAGSSTRPDAAASGRGAADDSARGISELEPSAGLEGGIPIAARDEVQLLDVEPVGRIEVPTPDAEHFVVEVVDAASGSLVPRAEIFWVELERHPGTTEWAQLADPSRLEELFSSRGYRTTADDLGMARIPRFKGRGAIAAKADRRWGCRRVPSRPDATQRVALVPDFDLPVQVVDSSGIGIARRPVLLLRRTGDVLHVAASATSDAARGIATIRHAGWLMVDASSQEWLVALEDTYDTRVQAPVSLASFGGGPIRLIHPDTGYLAVLVLDPDGQPTRGGVFVTLDGDGVAHQSRSTGEGRFDHFEPEEEGWTPQARAAQENAAVFFEVALGLEFTCSARQPRREEPIATVVARGPERAGETVRIELRPP